MTAKIDIDSIHSGELVPTNDRSPHNCVTLPEKSLTNMGQLPDKKIYTEQSRIQLPRQLLEVFPRNEARTDKLYAIYIYKRD